MKPAILYISYDGALEPLGQSQVVAYLEKLAANWSIHLLSFEKPADLADLRSMAAMKVRLNAAGIDWTTLPYHRTPTVPATAYDIAAGMQTARSIIRRKRVRIVHARSYIAGAIALAIKRTTGTPFIFDMRAFWPDERADSGAWPRDGMIYKSVKRLEIALLRAADHIVTLTNAAAREIETWEFRKTSKSAISVIPTCADLDRFCPALTHEARPLTFGHAGTVSGWYLLDETLAFYRHLTRQCPDARMIVVNRGEHDRVRQAAEKAGIDQQRITLVSSTHSDMPGWINRMDCGAAIIRPTFGKLGSAPTRLAEYLGCGIPAVGNTGVGDLAEILSENRIGVALPGFSEAELSAGARELIELLRDPETSARCIKTAHRIFSLNAGATRYDDIYRQVTV